MYGERVSFFLSRPIAKPGDFSSTPQTTFVPTLKVGIINTCCVEKKDMTEDMMEVQNLT